MQEVVGSNPIGSTACPGRATSTVGDPTDTLVQSVDQLSPTVRGPPVDSNDDAPALRQLARPRLYEAIAERVLSHIIQSDLRPGDKLPGERDLARRLGVSRTTVRQAMVALQSDGVVEVRHGGGTFLSELDGNSPAVARVVARRRRLPAVFEARRALEIPLASLAAERRTDADLVEIRAGLEEMREAVDAGEIGLESDGRFHAAVTAAAHNPVMAELMDALAANIAETRGESLSQPGRPPRSLVDHERIADAIAAGDSRAAAEAMRAHLDNVSSLRLFHWDPGADPDR